jgi:hypothetical protein
MQMRASISLLVEMIGRDMVSDMEGTNQKEKETRRREVRKGSSTLQQFNKKCLACNRRCFIRSKYVKIPN